MTPEDEVRLVSFARACGFIGPGPLILTINRGTTTLYGENGGGTGKLHLEGEKLEPLRLVKLKSYLKKMDTIGKLEMSVLSSISFLLCINFNKLLYSNDYKGDLVPRHLANHCAFYEFFCETVDDFLLRNWRTGFERDVKASPFQDTLIKRKFGYAVESGSESFSGSKQFGILSTLLELKTQREIVSSIDESDRFEDFILLWDFGDREYYKSAIGGMNFAFDEYCTLKSDLLESLYGYDLKEVIFCMYKNLSA